MSIGSRTRCTEAFRYAKAHLPRSALAGIAGADARALDAFAHLADLYTAADGRNRMHALIAMKHAALAMQPKIHAVAKQYLAHATDPEQAEGIWREILAAEPLVSTCHAVLHELEHGEASDATARDLRWCARALREALTKHEGPSGSVS